MFLSVLTVIYFVAVFFNLLYIFLNNNKEGIIEEDITYGELFFILFFVLTPLLNMIPFFYEVLPGLFDRFKEYLLKLSNKRIFKEKE